MVGVKDIKMKVLDCYQHKFGKSGAECDWCKAETLSGNLGFTVIEIYKEAKRPWILWLVHILKSPFFSFMIGKPVKKKTNLVLWNSTFFIEFQAH